MCGISGFVTRDGSLSEEDLVKMTNVLEHRGPDDVGFFYNSYSNYTVGLGHRRLSILDLSENGHQPMESTRFTMVYNGEVYNYKILKKALKQLGCVFNSDSDTEVILASFNMWGIKAVRKFNGMFSIALYDHKKHKLYFFRDRTGEKPFYYHISSHGVLFASELKSFHEVKFFKKKVNRSSVAKYLSYGYISAPNTIFKNTYKLESASYLEYDIVSGKYEIFTYWDIGEYYAKDKLNISFKDAMDETENLLSLACNSRMLSDVPVGVFLSGGYDSAAISAMLQKDRITPIKTFTIGFNEPKYNEANFAKKVSSHLGTEHFEHYVTQKEASNILQSLPDIYDEPFGDSSSIPTTIVSQFARNEVTVALSADGADELFSGYPAYHNNFQLFQKINKFKYLKKLSSFDKIISPFNVPNISKTYNFDGKFYKGAELLKNCENLSKFYLTTTKNFYDREVVELLGEDWHNQYQENFDSIEDMLELSYKTYLSDDILTKVDRATMSVGLEGREPFLDFNLVEFVAQLPIDYKQKGRTTKRLLKEIVHRHIPKSTMHRDKMGFSIPVFEWFHDEMGLYIEKYLSKESIDKSGIFNYSYVNKIIYSFRSRQGDPHKLWLLIVFQMWWFRWMND